MQKHTQNVKATRKRTIEIENGDVRRYADAVHAGDPVHNDPQAARKAGWTGLLAPPTFCATLGGYQDVLGEMELNPRQVLHSEQQLNELEPVCAGDSITVTTTLVDQYEKTTGSSPMGFVIVEDAGVNQHGRKVFFARRVIVIRGGFPRR